MRAARSWRYQNARGVSSVTPNAPWTCTARTPLRRRQRLPGRNLALRGAPAHHLESALAVPDPAHAVMDAPRPEPLLSQREPGAAPADQVLLGHTAARVPDLG